MDNILNDNNITVKCNRSGTRDTSGIIYGQGEAPRFELNDGGLTNELLNEIADKMAERWGLEVSIDKKGKREIGKTKFSLWDDRHKTLIRLNKIVKHQDWIDFTNNGKANYNLDDVLRYYDELDEIVKDKTGGILFETQNGASYNTLYHKQYDVINPIVISRMVYGSSSASNPSEYDMKQTMGHEGGHASERTLTQEMIDVIRKTSVGMNSYNSNRCTTNRERELYNLLIKGNEVGATSDVSHQKYWSDAMEQNKVPYASNYSATRGSYYSRNEEDFAETMSAVCYRNLKDKSGFQIRYLDGRRVGYDEFVKDHEATFKICCDYVDNYEKNK